MQLVARLELTLHHLLPVLVHAWIGAAQQDVEALAQPVHLRPAAQADERGGGDVEGDLARLDHQVDVVGFGHSAVRSVMMRCMSGK